MHPRFHNSPKPNHKNSTGYSTTKAAIDNILRHDISILQNSHQHRPIAPQAMQVGQHQQTVLKYVQNNY